MAMMRIDNLRGDAQDMRDDSRGGNDKLYGGDDNDFLHGDAEFMSDDAQGGNDKLYGEDDVDFLYGDAIVMDDQSRGGNDRLLGGDGNDFLRGDAFNLNDNSQGGNDFLFGEDGDDQLYGDALNASVGSQGGNDVLDGGPGDDDLTGGEGHDRFVFGANSGDDFINDFEPYSFALGNNDTIDLRGLGFANFVAVQAVTVDDGLGNTVITLPGVGNTIKLIGIIEVNLSASDFLL